MIYLLSDKNVEKCTRLDHSYNYTNLEYETGWTDITDPFYFAVSDNIEELNLFLRSEVTYSTLAPGDKVCFSNSDIPSLLLSRIKSADIKRTSKPSKSSKIITKSDGSCSVNYRNVYQVVYKDNTLYLGPRRYIYSAVWCDFNLEDKERFYKYMAGEQILYAYQLKKSEFEILVHKKNGTNFVKDCDFIKYISQFTTSIDDDEFESYKLMITSNDKSIRNIGLSALQYANLSDYMLELMYLLIDLSHNGYLENNAATKYIISCLGIEKSKIDRLGKYRNYNYYRYMYLDELRQLYKNDLCSQKSMDKIKEDLKTRILNKILEDDSIVSDLELINSKLVICDSDREAESSD